MAGRNHCQKKQKVASKSVLPNTPKTSFINQTNTLPSQHQMRKVYITKIKTNDTKKSTKPLQALSSDVTTLKYTNSAFISEIMKLTKELSVVTAAAAKLAHMLQVELTTGCHIENEPRGKIECQESSKQEDNGAGEETFFIHTKWESTKHLVALDSKLSKASTVPKKEVAGPEEFYYSKGKFSNARYLSVDYFH